MAGAEFKFEELTLANACGGRLEEKFQEALAPCIEALEQPSKFVSSAGEVVTAKVTVVLELSVNAEGVKTLYASAHPTLPKRKGVAEVVYTQNGVVMNQPGLHQMDFLAGEKKKPKVVEHPTAANRGE